MGMQARTRKEIGACLVVGRNIYNLDLDLSAAKNKASLVTAGAV